MLRHFNENARMSFENFLRALQYRVLESFDLDGLAEQENHVARIKSYGDNSLGHSDSGK